MKFLRLLALAALVCLGQAGRPAPADAHWSIGIGLGFPCYRPYGYYPYYYAPYPVYVAPAPVVVAAPAAVAVPAAPAVAPPVLRVSASEPVPDVSPASYASPGEVERTVQLLGDQNEKTRTDALMKLAGLKADRAVDAIAATLSGDRSPTVRETAARALGLIGSPRALTALKYAAQADADRDVRHSAQFAVEVIQSNMRR